MPVKEKYSGLKYKDRFDSKNKDFLKRNFEKSDAFYSVNLTDLNLDIKTNVPIHIYNFTTKANESKRFMTHPDYNYIDVGYIIHMNDRNYLITNIENHGGLNKFGMIQECNNILKWKDFNGNVYSSLAVVDTKRGFGDNNNKIQLVTNTLDVQVPNNSITSKIQINQRFIFNSRWAYRVNFINDVTDGGLILINLEFDEIKETDDLVNNIAFVEQTNNQTDTINGVYFDKTELNIKFKATDSISIYKYVNGIKQSDTFTFSIINIPSSAYEITNVDGNNISIKCLGYVHTGSIVANSNVDSSSYSIHIKLLGMF